MSFGEYVGFLFSVCDLNILRFYSWRESGNSLFCYKILFIDFIVLYNRNVVCFLKGWF